MWEPRYVRSALQSAQKLGQCFSPIRFDRVRDSPVISKRVGSTRPPAIVTITRLSGVTWMKWSPPRQFRSCWEYSSGSERVSVWVFRHCTFDSEFSTATYTVEPKAGAANHFGEPDTPITLIGRSAAVSMTVIVFAWLLAT